MREASAAPRLIVIADVGTYGPRVIEATIEVVRALPPGSIGVIERDRTGTPDRLRLTRLECLATACRAAEMPFAVGGGRADLALAVGADGVQLPEDAVPAEVVRARFPSLMIGRSCHDRAGLVDAARWCDWALLAPLRAPHSKPPAGGQVLGLDGFRAAVAGIAMPVYALGGVTADDMQPVVDAGGAGLATIGAVLGAADPAAAARAMVRLTTHRSRATSMAARLCLEKGANHDVGVDDP